jgi:NodT family efflux transporter outer membrane factor (OMF) lipoprotein
MRAVSRFGAMVASSLCLACASTPTRTEDPVALPASYDQASPAPPTNTPSAALLDWRQLFADPKLVSLLTEALRHNPDREIALTRIAMARAGVHRQTGALLPTVSAGAGASLRKFGLFTMDGAGNATTDIIPGELIPVHLPDLLIGVQSSWELDVWGRLWNQRQSSLARVLATREVEHFVESNLIADVAAAWFTLLALDQRKAVLEANRERQTAAVEFVKAQMDAGRANELAVLQFDAEVRETHAALVEVDREIRLQEGALNLLVGRVPQAIERDVAAAATTSTPSLLPGVPADLLRLRPDVRAAELELMAAGFDVQSAAAAFLPAVDLSATGGVQAFNPLFLLNVDSLAYNLVGGLLAPIVNRSGLEADHAGATAIQEEALVSYRKAILQALVETNNALTTVKASDDLAALQTTQRALRRRAVETSEILFGAGKAGWVEVLITQTATAEADLAVIDAWREQQLARVGLYRALGGGWTTELPPPTTVEQSPMEVLLSQNNPPGGAS